MLALFQQKELFYSTHTNGMKTQAVVQVKTLDERMLIYVTLAVLHH